mmetsp:Transcript_16204/g.46558  ORF Transcript_16204/g.46558 Transcript_16204/m.46558 type:complete len:572 (+) Transcript_16204:25-1740(+)
MKRREMGDEADAAAAASPPALDKLGSDEEARIERLIKVREELLDETAGHDEHDPQHLARSLSSFRGRGHHRRSIGGSGIGGGGKQTSVGNASELYVDDRDAFANSGSIEIPLSLSLGDGATDDNKANATGSSSSGEHGHPATLSVQSTKMALAWKIPPKRGARWSASFSSQSYAKQKLGYASCTSRIGYDLLPSTQLYTEMDLGVHPRTTIGAAVRLSQSSSIQIGLIDGGLGGLDIRGQRNLIQNRIGGTLALSMDPKRRFRVLQIGLITLVDRLPTLSLGINLGVNADLIRLSIENERASASVGWRGFKRGLTFDGMVRRSVSNFAAFGIGVRAVAGRGVAWLFQLERSEFVMKIPVAICPRLDAGSTIVLMYITFLSGVIDGIVGDFIGSTTVGLFADKGAAGDNKSNSIALFRMKKAKEDAERQRSLMERQAKSKRRRETERNGLVIDRAIYYIEGGDRLDVATQIQFWVTDSSLYLPPTPKSHLLGFYDVCSADKSKASQTKSSQLTSWKQIKEGFWTESKAAVPILYIRYTHEGEAFEVSIRDEEELVLPSPSGVRVNLSEEEKS